MKTAREVAHPVMTPDRRCVFGFDWGVFGDAVNRHSAECDKLTDAIEADRSTRGLDPVTIEAAARACEKSYRTAVGRMDRLTPEAAATAARGWAARCIRALRSPPGWDRE